MSEDIRVQNDEAQKSWVEEFNKKKNKGQEMDASIVAERDESMSFNAGLSRSDFRMLISEYDIEGATSIANLLAKNPGWSLETARRNWEVNHFDRSIRSDTGTKR